MEDPAGDERDGDHDDATDERAAMALEEVRPGRIAGRATSRRPARRVPLGDVEVGRVVRRPGAEAPEAAAAAAAPPAAVVSMTIVSSSGVRVRPEPAPGGRGADVPLVPVFVDRRFDLLNV